MKNANLFGTFLLSVVLATGLTACKHKSPMVTQIPGGGPPSASPGAGVTDQNVAPGTQVPVTSTPQVENTPIPLDNKQYTQLFNQPHNEDTEKFKADTIYFDFDSSTIKPSEESKLQAVADYFKNNDKMEALIIDGNCDERGTEKYNLSLGERRALAAREYLNNLGVKPERIKTVTYGASRPVDPGHNEEAWKQNRRDEFVLVTPK